MSKTNVTVKLVGLDGNVFSIIGRVSKSLERAGHSELAKEYRDRSFAATSYDEVLRFTMEYVDVE